MTTHQHFAGIPQDILEVKETFATGRSSGTVPDGDELPYSFEDIPLWVTAYFKDRIWVIPEKGEDLHEEDGRHLMLDAIDNRTPHRVIIHEDWIHLWFSKRTMLHVNWWEQ